MSSEQKKKSLAVVILAAGQGKRMKNPKLPKVLVPLSGKPLLEYVLEQVVQLTPDKTVIIVGHQKEQVKEFVLKKRYTNTYFAEQSEQLGTGHAVAQTEETLKDFKGDILILCGDVPLLTSESLKKFINAHYYDNSDLSVLSTMTANPTGYGRIVRDIKGNFIKITEEKDCLESERTIKEINSGVYMVRARKLYSALEQVSNNNAQGEYYLTDIVSIIREENNRVQAVAAAEFDELLGVNSLDDLEAAEKLYAKKNG